MILAEIITIGDELLIGQVVDTNSAWIAKQLNEIGIKVKQISSVGDDARHIMKSLDEASARAEIILITGGLGPTKDDITKKTLSKYFGSGTRFDEESFRLIESIFQARGRGEVTEINRMQAEVPDNCTVLYNYNGTAPGMWFEKDGRIYISMPGVPPEMKGMMEKTVIPKLKEKYSLPPIIHKTILTQGIGESFLSEKIAGWEDSLPPYMKLAYLPSAGILRLRITATGKDEAALRKEVEEKAIQLDSLVHEFIFGFEDDTLEAIIGRLLFKEKKTISTSESCTGGYIAHKITSVAGSSDYYLGSVVAYANQVKVIELGVPEDLIEEFGAVSEQVVSTMAKNAMKKFNSDYAIAASGIAGPSGGTPEKPVGTVWIAVGNREKMITRKLRLGSHRDRIIQETTHHALNTLRKMLLNEL